mmetsp:Transcript_26943/g.66409  ORF Transcript_26943/g.66409 Transcript_26943/m.66409 type:complete len:212 (+) Transcript_26943:2187-2822(+)
MSVWGGTPNSPLPVSTTMSILPSFPACRDVLVEFETIGRTRACNPSSPGILTNMNCVSVGIPSAGLPIHGPIHQIFWREQARILASEGSEPICRVQLLAPGAAVCRTMPAPRGSISRRPESMPEKIRASPLTRADRSPSSSENLNTLGLEAVVGGAGPLSPIPPLMARGARELFALPAPCCRGGALAKKGLFQARTRCLQPKIRAMRVVCN